MARKSSCVAVQPVGLEGVLTNSALVFPVIAASSLPMSSCHLPSSKLSGTATARTPDSSALAAKFGQAGVRKTISSPGEVTASMASLIDCMPEPVT